MDKLTPGVFLNEIDPFASSIVGVQTAVPAFVGYTQVASLKGVDYTKKPTPIASMAEYRDVFGSPPTEDSQGNPLETFRLTTPPAAGVAFDFTGSSGARYMIESAGAKARDGLLYYAMELFYENGGGACYVVSVGPYPDAGFARMSDLMDGLNALADVEGPTMLVVPDATLFAPKTVAEASKPVVELAGLMRTMLAQCAKRQDRVALLDAWHTFPLSQGSSAAGLDVDLDSVIAQFREDVGDEDLSYGIAYAPCLHTTVVKPADLTYLHFENTGLVKMLKEEASLLYPEAPATTPGGRAIADPRLKLLLDLIDSTANKPAQPPAPGVETPAQINNKLTGQIPLLKRVYEIVAARLNVLPPSAAMAGVVTRSDEMSGVWNAPANLSLAKAMPVLQLNSDQQEDLNAPSDGKAVNAIREIVGRGAVVAGARTLDGNSADWRYVQIRRTVIYVEQSVQSALKPLVFTANDATTWATVIAMVSNFLEQLWSQGGLMGATAKDAYTVQCGLGTTMTSADVLQGVMIVQVTLQTIHPANFIELTFKQTMQSS